MSTEILISSDPWENRVAILENGSLAELYIEREEKVIGSIYKGKVQNVLPGMGAAFVDIGLGRNAFLYVDDISKQPLNIGDVEVTSGRSGFTITDKVKKGDDALVQIVKEPRGLKGARISTNVSLPGRYLILMPTGRYSGVSRKIESAAERDRLKGVMKRIRPEGMATVVRTAAAGVSEAELIADLGVLIRMWHGILETYKRAASPSLLHKDMNLIYKAARDFITADVDKVLIDNEAEFKKVRDFLQLLGPQYIDRLEHYNNGRSLFDDYRVNEELHKLMKSKVNLPSGGSIVIESTEALTVIDVNSGKFTGGKNLEDTIVKTNIEAAAEVARQVRLRDIGGIIVVDFIDMSTEPARNNVIKVLEDGLRRDRTRSTIQSFSNLGLLEFTRKRIGKDLGAQLRGSCPTCAGMGSVLSAQSVAIDTLRHVRESSTKNHQPVVVHAAPTVAAQLDFWYEAECDELAKELDTQIHVRVDPMLHPERSRVEHVAEFKEEKGEVVRVGDEHSVELLSGRLPNATSAAAVVGGHIVEVENAANNAGNSARIRILDVEDDYVLAELLSADVKSAEPKTKKRRRGGKRNAPMTAAEQAAQLRELAKEAAEQSEARPPIGITTVTEEEERLDKTLVAEARAERTSDAIVISEGEVQHGEGEDGARRRRRRRRRGRGAAGAGTPQQAAPAAVPAPARVERVESDEAAGDEGEGGHRRRRRRRRGRGRGRGVEGQAGSAPQNGAAPPTVPDRHIFRVQPDGNAEPTGRTAPPEPSRAIALRRRVHPPAVDAPPPSLTAPVEKPKPTKPARRRSSAPAVAAVLKPSPVAALPAARPASTLVRAKPKAAVKVAKPAKPAVARKAASATKAPVAKPKRAAAAKAAPKKKASAAPSKRKK
ncbi:MAG TPA: Rne/Rng family ribonuclease [Candidatus Baltobacteraceae bacterium]